MGKKLPPLPKPYQSEIFATAENTPSVRAGYEMSGYLKSPALFTGEQLKDFAHKHAEKLEAENARLVAEVANRNKRALEGDEATALRERHVDKIIALEVENAALRSSLKSIMRYASCAEGSSLIYHFRVIWKKASELVKEAQ